MAFSPEHAYDLVKAAHERGRLAHAFLISGPVGCGKERIAARLIRMLNSDPAAGGFDLFGEKVAEPEPPPLDELAGEWVQILRPQSRSRRIVVDAIRDIEKRLYIASGPRTWKIAVIVDADRMVPAAENAFLKTLEEPPPQTLLLLLTSNPGGLLPTVLSRCVRLPLIGKPDLEAGRGGQLVSALNRTAKSGFGSPTAALGLKAVFSSLLEECKSEAVEAAEEILKVEEKALKNAIEGDYLKRREEMLKAAAEADYLQERSRLFEVLQSWFGDVLRSKSGAGGLEFPGASAETAAAGGKESLDRLIRRMEAIGQMKSTLETNTQEQLALEVGFLQAFA